jgi:hypothetical protein
MPLLAVQNGTGEINMPPAKTPITSKERKHLLQSFSELPPSDRKRLNTAVRHLRWLMILWGLEELDPDSMPSIPEKRHILLAYKFLEILWFSKLPENSSQAFTLYVRDQLPDNQKPESINDVFDRGVDELAGLCEEMARPNWLKNTPAVMTSMELFPRKSLS